MQKTHEYIIQISSNSDDKYIITFGPKGKYDEKCGIEDSRRGVIQKSETLFTSANWELCQHVTRMMEVMIKLRFQQTFRPCGGIVPDLNIWKSCHIVLQHLKGRELVDRWFAVLSAEIMSIFSAINGDVRAVDDKIAQQSEKIGEMEKKIGELSEKLSEYDSAITRMKEIVGWE